MSYYMDGQLLPGFTTLAEIDEGGGYDWHTAVVVERDSDGALFYAEGSGCSCNYFGEYIRSEADLLRIERYSDAIALLQSADYGFPAALVCEFAGKLMALPAPRAFQTSPNGS